MNVGSASHTGALDAAWLSHKSLYGRPRSVLIRAGVLRTAFFFLYFRHHSKESQLACGSLLPSMTRPPQIKCPRGGLLWKRDKERKGCFFMYGRVGARKLVVQNN